MANIAACGTWRNPPSNKNNLRVQLRPINKDTLATWRVFNRAVFPSFSTTESSSLYQDLLRSSPEEYRQLAYNDTNAVGSIICRLDTDNTEHSPTSGSTTAKRLYITSIGVLSSYRRRNVATTLLEHVLAQAAATHNDSNSSSSHIQDIYLQVDKNNTPALHFFQQFGFHPVTTTDNNDEDLCTLSRPNPPPYTPDTFHQQGHAINYQYPGLRLIHQSPAVFAVDAFFTANECDLLIEKAKHAKNSTTGKHLLLRSTIRDETDDNGEDLTSMRTSNQVSCTQREIPGLISKMTSLLQCAPRQLERVNVVRYQTGQYYRPHCDEDDGPDTMNGFEESQRLVTLFVYLNDLPSGGGGATRFLDCGGGEEEEEREEEEEEKGGLCVQPKKGMGCIHFPGNKHYKHDERTIHEGVDVIGKENEKWLMVVWMWMDKRNLEGEYAEKNMQRLSDVTIGSPTTTELLGEEGEKKINTQDDIDRGSDNDSGSDQKAEKISAKGNPTMFMAKDGNHYSCPEMDNDGKFTNADANGTPKMVLDDKGSPLYLAKDSEEYFDEEEMKNNAMERAAQVQCDLIVKNIETPLPTSRSSTVMAAASSLLLAPLVWEAPISTRGSPLLYENVYPVRAGSLHRRVVVDSILTLEESAMFAHHALDRFGDPMFGEEKDLEEDKEDSERGVAWCDWAENPLNDYIRIKLCKAIRLHFGETRPLYLAGAMNTRKTPGCGISPCHVDQANIGYYDYSAVLYHNTHGVDFEGGNFLFRDLEGDEIVEPKAGRCVLFTSGAEHLHQVETVTSGVRYAMGMWFTLAATCGGSPQYDEEQ